MAQRIPIHPLTPIMAVLVAYVLLALCYLWATPPFEASDELWHFGMVDYLADTGALAVQVPGEPTQYKQEGSQPPLYYALTALLVRGIDRSDFEALTQPNPHAKAGIAVDSDNKNLVLHTPVRVNGNSLTALYLIRLLSIACGAVTIYAVYRSGLLIASPRVALLAAGLVAFNPMFLFISASVNNDNLVTMLNSLLIWQGLATFRHGFATSRSIVIALLFTLTSLTKLSGLLTAPFIAVIGFTVVIRAWQTDRAALVGALRGLVLLGGSMVLVWTVLAGWWYARNLMLYDELFGTRMMAMVAGVRMEPFSLATLVNEFEGFRIAYWGLFGAVNILTHPLFYIVMDGVTVVALAGVTVTAMRNPAMRLPLALLSLPILLGFLSVTAWTAITYASQGRLLFPVIACISLVMALGLNQLSRYSVTGIAALAVFALIVPFAYIAPRYAPPAQIEALPTQANPVFASWGDVQLVGYEATVARYQPGDRVPITVYWQVSHPSERNYSLFLHLVTRDGTVIGKVDTYPGGGNTSTTHWSPGLYRDAYTVLISDGIETASDLRVQVAWYEYPELTRLPTTDREGTPLDAVMLDVGGYWHNANVILESATSVTARFGSITLLGYRQEGRQLTLLWQSGGPLDDDYRVFVQALAPDGTVAAQGDAAPTFPTRYWGSGETYLTTHELVGGSAGTYPVVIGWYRLGDFYRLPTDAPDGSFALGDLTIE